MCGGDVGVSGEEVLRGSVGSGVCVFGKGKLCVCVCKRRVTGEGANIAHLAALPLDQLILCTRALGATECQLTYDHLTKWDVERREQQQRR